MLFLRSKYRKKGPPHNAVIIPTGNSVGATAVLASVSAKIRKIAPDNVAAGTRVRWLDPTTSLDM